MKSVVKKLKSPDLWGLLFIILGLIVALGFFMFENKRREFAKRYAADQLHEFKQKKKFSPKNALESYVNLPKLSCSKNGDLLAVRLESDNEMVVKLLVDDELVLYDEKQIKIRRRLDDFIANGTLLRNGEYISCEFSNVSDIQKVVYIRKREQANTVTTFESSALVK